MTADDLLKREFNALRRSGIDDHRVDALPLPSELVLPDLNNFIDQAQVQYCTEEYFDKLNNNIITFAPPGAMEYVRDRHGNIIESKPLKGKSKSLIVESTISLGLPYKYTYPDGYGYFGYRDATLQEVYGMGGEQSIRLFRYLIPRDNLYRVNQTALVISTRKLRCYDGRSYSTWDNGVIYCCIVPYTARRTYTNTKILAVGRGLDYSALVSELEYLWIQSGIIADPSMAFIEDDNLVIHDIDCEMFDYSEVSSDSLTHFSQSDLLESQELEVESKEKKKYSNW